MNNIVWIDLETRSTIGIRKGTYRYAEGSEILTIQYAFNEGEVKIHEHMFEFYFPEDLAEAMADQETLFVSHGSFDRILLNHHGYEIPLERWHDTMAMAMANGLPGSLAKLCELLDLPENMRKLPGKELIQLFCKLNRKGVYNDPKTHAKEWQEFLQYADRDITAMREIARRLPRHNWQSERQYWMMYERMNDQGFKIDVELAERVIEHIDYEKKQVIEETGTLTGGVVGNTTQTEALRAYVEDRIGQKVHNLTSASVRTLLSSSELPGDIQRLLELRQTASKSSTAKYKKALECKCSDDYMRGAMVFNGAMRTGRNTGRLYQPLNLPRPKHKDAEIREFITSVKCGMGFIGRDSVMGIASSALRGLIVAGEGNKFVVSDWKNIEGRIQAWISGEEWKLQAFRDFDGGKGFDLYKIAYGRMMNKATEEVDDKDERQTGKVSELAFAYGGSVAPFLVFGAAYNLDIVKLCNNLQTPNEMILSKAHGSYDFASKHNRTLGLSREQYIKLSYIVHSWRAAHPRISKGWNELDELVKYTVRMGIKVPSATKPFMDGKFLAIPLPSGRRLMYLNPRVDDSGISYIDGRYGVVRTYGSKIYENIVQAINADTLRESIPLVKAYGYVPKITVYDELVTETEDSDKYDDHQLSKLLCINPEWAKGLPLAAEGFQDYIYRKA